MNQNTGTPCVDTHVHELLGSVKISDNVCIAHNHRIAAVTGRPILLEDGCHAHDVCFLTDSFEGHSHEYRGRTSGAFPLLTGHVHYLEGMVARVDDHRHCFKISTQIAEPICE